MGTYRRATLLAAVVALAAPAAAHAAPDWTAPASAPFDGRLGSALGFAAGGTETAAHIEITNFDPANLATRLVVSVKPPGGSFAEQLSIPSTPTAVPVDLRLAVAPNGAAALAWTENTTANYAADPPKRLRVAYRTPAGAWDAPVLIGADTAGPDVNGNIQVTPLAAIGDDGTAVAGGTHQEPNDVSEPAPGQPDSQLDVAIHDSGGSWHGVETISPHNKAAHEPVAGVDAAGNVTVAWLERWTESSTSATTNDLYTAIVRRRLTSNGIWGLPEDITGSDSARKPGSPRLGVAASGAAVLTFETVLPSGPNQIEPWAVTRPDSAHAFAGFQPIVSGGASGHPMAAGVAPDGTAYVVYWLQGNSSADDHAGAVKLPPGGSWSAPHAVSPLNFHASGGGVAFLGNDAFLAWKGAINSGASAVEAVRWPAGAAQAGSYRDLDTGANASGFVGLVPDRDGSVVAGWPGSGGTSLRSSAYDAGPPNVVAAGPSTAVAGQPTTFTASFVDLWSALAGAPAWSFGDGGTGSGAAVAHTFAAPGPRMVTVAQADALGNAQAHTFTVNVTPAGGATDTAKPKVTLTKPAKRRRGKRSAWRTLKGKVTDPAPSSGIAKVEVGVELKRGKKTFALSGKRFKASTHAKAKKKFVAAKVKGGAWSLKLPALKPGTYTFRVRATDRAGHVSATVAVTVRLK